MKLHHTGEAYEVGAERWLWQNDKMLSGIRVLIESALHNDYAQSESEETKKKALSSLLSKVWHVIVKKSKQMEEERSHSLFVAYKYILDEHKRSIEALKDQEEIGSEPRKWPAYASEEFGKIVENSKGLENAGDDTSQILYHVMEIQALLRKVVDKARVTNKKYEGRLAASLRNICNLYEPDEFSDEQIKRFIASMHALIEGWGQLNREKVKWIRSRLLEVGLTWLPVTEKAQRDIAEAKKLAGIDEH